MPVLPDNINTADTTLVGPVVLQVVSVANISQPSRRQSEDSQPRVLQLRMTDGHIRCVGVEKEHIASVSASRTAPGTKVRIANCEVLHGKLLLNPNNVEFFGGYVEQLYTSWRANRETAKLAHGAREGRGSQANDPPPPFAAFTDSGPKQQRRAHDKKSKKRTSEVQPETAEHRTTAATAAESSQKRAGLADRLQQTQHMETKSQQKRFKHKAKQEQAGQKTQQRRESQDNAELGEQNHAKQQPPKQRHQSGDPTQDQRREEGKVPRKQRQKERQPQHPLQSSRDFSRTVGDFPAGPTAHPGKDQEESSHVMSITADVKPKRADRAIYIPPSARAQSQADSIEPAPAMPASTDDAAETSAPLKAEGQRKWRPKSRKTTVGVKENL